MLFLVFFGQLFCLDFCQDMLGGMELGRVGMYLVVGVNHICGFLVEVQKRPAWNFKIVYHGFQRGRACGCWC